MIGRVRPAVAGLSGYTPGKDANQVADEHDVVDAIKLASNENPWSPSPGVAKAITDAVAGVNRYADNGATDVRTAIGEWLDIDPSNITVGCGSSGILQQVFMTYVDPGDGVIFPYPSFEIYPIFSTLFDAVDVRTPLVDHAFDLDAVAAAVTEKTKLIFLATPNNPTGTSIAMADVEQLLDRIPSDVVVVIDEAYREFNDPSFGDPVSLLHNHRNVIITRTFSKAFGLAGMRAGYAVTDPEIVTELDKVRLAFSVNNLAQVAMLAAIEFEDEAMENVDILLAERQRCVDALIAEGVELPPTHANFVFIPTGDSTSKIALAMEKQGIVTRPFSGVGLRVTVGSPEQNDRWLAAFLTARSAA